MADPPTPRAAPHDGYTEAQRLHQIETYKALFIIGPAAVKTLLTLNGGASLALLAFVGHLIGGGKPAMSVVGSVYWSFMWFLLGAALCGAAMIAGYAAQLMLFNETKLTADPPYLRSHRIGIHFGMACCLVALICFVVGALLAIGGLARMPTLTARLMSLIGMEVC